MSAVQKAYRPEQEGSLALPQNKFGLDVIAYMIKTIRETSERLVSGVALKYGKDSREYEMTGGVRKNDACGRLRLRIPILIAISVLLGATHSLDCGKIGRDRFTRRLRDAMNRVFTRDCCFHISLMFWLEEVFFFPTLHLSLSLVDAKLDKKRGRAYFGHTSR
ncbi:hypothetical protein GNF10_23450 [Nostoc sp. UCD121]|uniref:hypothetical protein n=1 Tax=unclassified Nostoc TaxID=2593658 RepID=UPI0016262564|nr:MULTISPECIES: hypothetical protein [unclassified Nostoc]MBC1220890.1 hypothetical protein [Nostoc sp. UCD120]MBC1278841.1 hypothetical protein [Nostoc sp. UCD121]MBC1294389.1 hypothetical protein [Nostoc sp. UCD122]